VTFTNGQVVKKNDHVLIEFAVVNRDDAVWPEADKLDFHRTKPPAHFSFTGGAHACVGQHLAKLQIRLTVETLVRRFPNLELAIPPEEVAFDPDSFMRSTLNLPLKW
jgi:cytochrome P450